MEHAIALSRRDWLILVAAGAASLPQNGWAYDRLGRLEHDVHSDYSHIRIRRLGNVRTMSFVRDTGEEVLETQIDLARPHQLHFAYLQHMFLSYLFVSEPKRVLIVGLGGGSMIHFLTRAEPNLAIDAVEIDPLVVQLADKYFGTRPQGQVKIFVEDGFEFLARCQETYDVIYMDAFLKPSAETDSTGVPLKTRTQQFYRNTQKKLTETGLMVFNINPHDRIEEDVATIRESFPQTYVFGLPQGQGVVAIGSMAHDRVTPEALQMAGAAADARLRATFSLQLLARHLVR